MGRGVAGGRKGMDRTLFLINAHEEVAIIQRTVLSYFVSPICSSLSLMIIALLFRG